MSSSSLTDDGRFGKINLIKTICVGRQSKTLSKNAKSAGSTKSVGHCMVKFALEKRICCRAAPEGILQDLKVMESITRKVKYWGTMKSDPAEIKARLQRGETSPDGYDRGKRFDTVLVSEKHV